MNREQTDRLPDAREDGLAVVREPWMKPEIASFEPVAAAQGAGFGSGDAQNNLS